jgi:hypothetical protein
MIGVGLLLAAATLTLRAVADDLWILGQTDSPGEMLTRAAVDARYGWLTLTEIGDAREALRAGRSGEARALVAGAQARLLALQEVAQRNDVAPPRPALEQADIALLDRTIGLPRSSTRARLADAEAAIHDGRTADAAAILTDAERPLHTALTELDDQLDPQSGIISGTWSILR